MKQLCYVLVIAFCIGCRQTEDERLINQYPGAKVLNEAVDAFGTLLGNGRVPALAAGEQIKLETLPLVGEAAATTYPLQVTIKIDAEKSPGWPQYYTMQKDAVNSKWQIAKAWKQNASSSEKIDLMASDKK